MEGERRSSVTLPEELVGRILGMVPFPQIFKAPDLSKSWRAKFSPISPHSDVKERFIATWFQEQVGEWSSKWRTFCPSTISHDDVIAHDRASHYWQRMPLLSFRHKHIFKRPSKWRMEGSLLLVKIFRKRNASCTWDFYIANILTRTWKRLPPRPHANSSALELLIYTKPTYKVIDFEEDWGAKHFSAHTYDSNLHAWRSIKVSMSRSKNFISNWTHLDGVLYRVVGPNCLKASGLHTFGIKEGTLETLHMSSSIDMPTPTIELVVCNTSLLMLVFKTFSLPESPKADILMAVKSRRWLKVTPPSALHFGRFYAMPGIDSDCMIFAREEVGSGVIAYDVQKDEWSHSPGLATSRQFHDVAGRTLVARVIFAFGLA